MTSESSKKKSGEIKKFLESNENENTVHEILWDAAKATLKKGL
jgi:hypothetical protein